jgi:hypothetical protein
VPLESYVQVGDSHRVRQLDIRRHLLAGSILSPSMPRLATTAWETGVDIDEGGHRTL